MDFTFISRYIEIFLMVIMMESLHKISLKQLLMRLPIIVLISFLILRYGLYTFDTYLNMPLIYYFYNEVSILIVVCLILYSILFHEERVINHILFSSFIVFNVTLYHTLVLFVSSLFVESASFFVYSESMLYYIIPFISYMFLLIEVVFLRRINIDYIDVKVLMVFIGLFIADIIIMNYLGYMYIFNAYDSLYMFINIILIILITFVLVLLFYYMKKYYEALSSTKVYNASIEHHRKIENLIQEQYQLIKMFNHDYKYYLLKMKDANRTMNLEEFQGVVDAVLERYSKDCFMYTNYLMLDLLFNEKNEQAILNGINFKYLINGKIPEYVKEYDIYYAIDNILNIIMKDNIKEIDIRLISKENLVLNIKTNILNKKNQEQILVNIKPVLDKYHGFAFFDIQNDKNFFAMSLCNNF